MNKKLIFLLLSAFMLAMGVHAQRFMDTLDRGLVAVKQASGVFLSWRIYGTEYYNVGYNVYRDGTRLNAMPLYVSNYTDASGSLSSTYAVAPVVNGVEQGKSAAVKVWGNDYLVIPKAKRISNDGKTDITSAFEPNDATFGDVDGDGQMEVFIKEWNTVDNDAGFPLTSIDFDRIEVYKLDGTLLWWIDCGPNLTDFQHNETNIAVYDWDMDGKAEAVMRAADGTIIHMADGTTYEIGDKTKNYRADLSSGQTEKFIHTGSEFLVYMNGQTGKPYYCGEYPLKRLENGETDLNAAWGDGYGHRSSKHFFGAPYFDGKNPSIFLARGIYTRHKMIAYDVDPATHELKVRWRWNCNTPGSPWYGQGYHNYSIADVDWDGRDEICFGSMVIDDDGLGLSTTGLGHGDSQHVGDFNPYIHGQEIFACNEDNPANNYRDATTSKIYYRLTGGGDDGRAIAGNFSDDYPGAMGFSGHDTPISCVTNGHVDGLTSNGVTLNFRTYWDGDLCEESFNGVGTRNSNGAIYKYGQGNIRTFDNTYTNNDTKATPCFQGDIFGDWREEIAMRDADNNLRIFTTTIPTPWRNYTLLHDPQYRNAMVWQMNGYNQPPHVSYFLGEKEGITVAPPPATRMGKEVVANGGTVSSAYDGKQVLLDETGDATYTISNGASPDILFDNAPTWVKGHDDNNKIEYITYTHTINGGALSGSTRLVKQGDGILNMPAVVNTYTGPTEIWGGTLNFDGTLTASRLWLNRFTTLNTKGGKFNKGIEAEYGASVRPGGKDTRGSLQTDSLLLNFGSEVDFDIFSDGSSDTLTANVLRLEKKDWANGPEHLAPRFNFTEQGGTVTPGVYVLGKVGQVIGDLNSVEITGLTGYQKTLSYENGELLLTIASLRAPESVVWTGTNDGSWLQAAQENFKLQSDGSSAIFVTGDKVTFDDNASQTNVEIGEPVYPSVVTFANNQKAYTLTGNKISGNVTLTQSGSGSVTVSNVNDFAGTINLNGGSMTVGSLGFKDGSNTGALGIYTNTVSFNGGTLVANSTMNGGHAVVVGSNGGTISTASGSTLTLSGSLKGTGTLTKSGSGTLVLAPTVSLSKLYVNGGVVQAQEQSSEHRYPANIVLNGGTIVDPDDIYSYSTNSANIEVPEGAQGTWYMDQRCVYSGKLTGAGTLTAYATGPRMSVTGNWSNFEGTLSAMFNKTGSYDPEFTFNNAGLRNGVLKVNSGVTVNNSGKTFYLGNLTGAGTVKGSGQYIIGSRDENVTFTGTFSGTTFVKVGSGLWTLSRNSASSFSGSNYVRGGTLNLNDASATTQFFGTNSIVAADSGRVAGQAYLYRVDVQSGGTLAPGSATSSNPTGSIKADYVYVQDGGTLEFQMNTGKNTAAARTFITVSSVLEINGTVAVKLRSGYVPVVGDSCVIWTCGTLRGTPTYALPDLSAFTSTNATYGLKWDVSGVGTTGVLRIIARTKDDVTSGIDAINAGASVKLTVYGVDGTMLGTADGLKADLTAALRRMGLPKGIYVVHLQAGTAREVTKVTLR
jgi:autotransporter-associated beta strand protein